MEKRTMDLMVFGMEQLGYAKDFHADNYFKKKFNDFWTLTEENNTGTYQEIMTFAKEKASKGSKLIEWYNKELEELLKDTFTDKLDEEVVRTTFVREKAPRKATPKKEKKEKVVGETTKKVKKEIVTTKEQDEELLGNIFKEEGEKLEQK